MDSDTEDIANNCIQGWLLFLRVWIELMQYVRNKQVLNVGQTDTDDVFMNDSFCWIIMFQIPCHKSGPIKKITDSL